MLCSNRFDSICRAIAKSVSIAILTSYNEIQQERERTKKTLILRIFKRPQNEWFVREERATVTFKQLYTCMHQLFTAIRCNLLDTWVGVC